MRRNALVFVLVLFVAALMVGCGSPDEGSGGSSAGKKPEKASGKTSGKTEPTPIEAVRVAYETTVEEQTARVVSTTKTSGMTMGSTAGEQAPMEFTVSSDGVVDLGGRKALTTVRMGGPLGSMEVRQIGGVAYQKLPQEMQTQIPGIKPWIRMDVDSFYREQYGASLSEMQAGAPTDPTHQLEYLKSVGSVEKAGQEKVRGVPTTHYRAVVDLEREADLNGDPQVQKAYEKLRGMIGSSELPVDVWLDNKDRIRRYEMEMPIEVDVPMDPSAPKGKGGATGKVRAQVSMTQDIFDFGVPVNVSPPPPEKTMDYKEFQQQMQQIVPSEQT